MVPLQKFVLLRIGSHVAGLVDALGRSDIRTTGKFLTGLLALTLWRSFSRGRREQRTWRSFLETFVAEPEIVRDKRKVAGFSLAAFTENRRSLPRVEQVHALILDFDEGDTTTEQAPLLLPGVSGVTYTTFRHTKDHPKLRIIFPLSRPVDAEEYARIWTWVAGKITKTKVLDESTRDASRFWYLPSHPPGAEYEWRELEGKELDVARALKESKTTLLRPFPVLGKAPGAPPKGKGRRSADPTDADQTFFGRAFAAADMAFDLLDNGALSVVCPWASVHTSGEDGDSSTVVFPATTEGGWGLFHCSHAHCVGRSTSDLLDALPAAALETARSEHGRGLARVRVIDGWMQRLEAQPGFEALDRFILKCRPREGGAVFTMTVKISSSMHINHLDALPLPLLIGRRLDVSMEGRTVKAARLVAETFDRKTARARGSALLAGSSEGDLIVGADFDFLFSLLRLSSRPEAMIGPGVRKIRVRANGHVKLFEVVRVDGSCVELGRSLGK